MYPRPIIPHGFNHQSYYRQPVLNLRPINQIVWNGNQSHQQMGPMNSSSFGSVHNHSLPSQPGNVGHSIRLALTDHTQPQIERRQDRPEARTSSNSGVNYPQGNGSTTNGFAASARTGYVPDQSKHSLSNRFHHNDLMSIQNRTTVLRPMASATDDHHPECRVLGRNRAERMKIRPVQHHCPYHVQLALSATIFSESGELIPWPL